MVGTGEGDEVVQDHQGGGAGGNYIMLVRTGRTVPKWGHSAWLLGPPAPP